MVIILPRKYLEKIQNVSLIIKKLQVRTEKDNQTFECSSGILVLPKKNLKFKWFLLGMAAWIKEEPE